MKKSKKKKLEKMIEIIIFVLITSHFISLLLETGNLSMQKGGFDSTSNPKASSSFYNLTGIYMESYIYDSGGILTGETNKIIAPILIDDTLENQTWSYINNTYPWCSGAGTPENPYIIENVFIDGLYMSNTYNLYSNILIRHSRAHFIIQHCSIHKNGKNERGSLFFYNVTNGIIRNNELTLNGNSIRLHTSHNFMIQNNYIESIMDQEVVGTGKAIWCTGDGINPIWEIGCSNNTIYNNTIINHYDGIVSMGSLNLNITHNFLNNTLFGHYPDTGLYLKDTNHSYVTYNTFAGDYAEYLPEGESIINQQNCEGNSIIEAFIIVGSVDSSSIRTQQTIGWFNLLESNNNYIYGNRLVIPGYIPPTSPPNFIGIDISIILIIIIAFISTIIVINEKKSKNGYLISFSP